MYDQNLADQAADLLARRRERRPLVHHITNNVTVNDVANVTLQLGALPIMAPSSHEAADMVAHASALVLNIGTPDPDQLEAMTISSANARIAKASARATPDCVQASITP